MFLKLEVSAVLADSPMYRCRAVKEMRELEEEKSERDVSWGWFRGKETESSREKLKEGARTHGVARLETSLAW